MLNKEVCKKCWNRYRNWDESCISHPMLGYQEPTSPHRVWDEYEIAICPSTGENCFINGSPPMSCAYLLEQILGTQNAEQKDLPKVL